MKFNIDDYKGKYAMHCKTEEEAINFCNYLHSLGKMWCDRESYLNKNNYRMYYSKTAYSFNEGVYCDTDFYVEEGYTILEWSDFMNKEFTKANLKTGDVVKFRNDEIGIVNGELKTIVVQDGWYDLLDIKPDLTNMYEQKGWDIVAIRRPKGKSDCQFDAFRCERGTLVYERKEVEEMTLEQVCKLLGKEIKIVK